MYTCHKTSRCRASAWDIPGKPPACQYWLPVDRAAAHSLGVRPCSMFAASPRWFHQSPDRSERQPRTQSPPSPCSSSTESLTPRRSTLPTLALSRCCSLPASPLSRKWHRRCSPPGATRTFGRTAGALCLSAR
eukprot:747591-Hanusia_phi.AAC.2